MELRLKEKLSDTPGHDILELYNVLVQIQFATSRKELCISYKKLDTIVALRDSCNQFVYNFYPQSILVLEECLKKW